VNDAPHPLAVDLFRGKRGWTLGLHAAAFKAALLFLSPLNRDSARLDPFYTNAPIPSAPIWGPLCVFRDFEKLSFSRNLTADNRLPRLSAGGLSPVGCARGAAALRAPWPVP
jgi:hypothetical protein